jgi:predicted nucleotide-binding protein
MSIEFLKSDFEKVSYLASLLTSSATGGDASDPEYKDLRHELLSKPQLIDLLPDWLKIHRDLSSFWGFIQPKFGTYADRRKFLSEEFSPILNVLEFGHTIEAEKQHQSKPVVAQKKVFPEPVKKKIFIVHGRDNEAKQEISRYIESLGIGVIILHEQASSGMTIIEKIEHYSNEADFALVLYTACDLGRGLDETKVHPKNRARQNVVFEHGYLMAKLGRKNVCALVKGEIETPNDISGVVYVPLDSLGAWKLEVNKELKVCGYKVP